MRLLGTILAVFLVLAGAALVTADTSQRCVTANLTDNDNTVSAIYEVRPQNAPWTAWLGTIHGTSATVVVTGYGPCLDNRSAATCSRGSGFTLGTLSGSTLAIAGPGPVDAVQFNQTTPCGTPTCVSGVNENGACSANSACPGSTCGPCTTEASFCGVNASGIE